MSSTVIRVPRITGFPIIITGLISIRSVVIAIPFTHHSAPTRVAQSPLATSSRRHLCSPLACPERSRGATSLIFLSILWRPFLRAVDDVCDFHNVLTDPVHHHERKRWQRKFTRPFHTALSTLVGKRLQRTSTLVDSLGNPLGGGRIFLPDVFDNS